VVQRALAGIALADADQQTPSRWFTVQVVAFLAAASLVEQWRLLLGRVPFAGELVTNRPIYRNVPGAARRPGHHADLNDLAHQFYEFRFFAHESLQSGHLATWNPRILEGAPFLANLQSALLYPPNLVLYGLLPANTAWGIGFWLRPVLGGCFTALLVRALGASRTGALVAAVAFGFSGFLIGWSGWPQADSVVWLPLGLYAVHRLSKAPTALALAGTSVALALPILGGHPEVSLFGAVATTLFAGHRAIFRENSTPSRRRFLLAFAGAALLAGGLAAMQLVPTAEWVGQLQRYEARQTVPALPAHDVLSFVSRDAQADPNSMGLDVSGAAGYVGLLALVVAPLGLLHRNRRDAIFFAILAAGTAQVVYGIGPLAWLSHHVPIIHSVANAMAVGVLDLSVVVLAALGVTVLQDAHRLPRQADVARVLAGVTAAGCGVALAFAVKYGNDHPHADVVDWFRGGASSAAFIALALVVCVVATSGRLRASVLSILLIGIALLDSTSYAYGHVPFLDSAKVAPPAPAFDALRRLDPTTYRIAAVDGAYTPNLDMLYGFDSATGYDFPTADVARLLDPVGVQFISFELTSEKIATNHDRRLDLMNLKYLFTVAGSAAERTFASEPDRYTSVINDGAVNVFLNRQVLPRAFVVPYAGFRQVADTTAGFDALADPRFDPSKQAIIVSSDVIAAPGPTSDSTTMPPVTDLRVDDTDVTMTVDAPVDAVVVLSEAMYPGWQVEVDGHASTLLRTDAMFQGVAVTAGHHTVRFVFRSDSVRTGAFISTASLAVLAGLVIVPLARRRRSRRGSP